MTLTTMEMDRSLDVDFADAWKMGDGLLVALDLMRENSPLYWSQVQQAWIVTGHQEVIEAFRNMTTLSAARLPHLVVSPIPEEERAARIPYLMETTPLWVLNMDSPGHLRLRRLLLKAFSRKVAEGLRPYAKHVIQEVLASAAQKGRIDFVEDVARPIPGRIILNLMGLSDKYLPNLRDWANGLTAALSGQLPTAEVLENAERVLQEMRKAFRGEIEKRREAPADDFISALISARDEGDQLSEEEMIATCHVTLIAGHETTTNSMALGALALARNPTAIAQLRSHPEDIGNAVLELARHSAMSTSQSRIVAEDFEWHGHLLRKGQFVFIMVAAANRDPRVFHEPLKLDLTRDPQDNVTFGPGLHHCIGHLLAKMQLSEFFSTLVDSYDLRIIDEAPRFGPSISFRGLDGLAAELKPRDNNGI